MRHGIGGTTRHRVETAWGPCVLDRSARGVARFRLPDPAAAESNVDEAAVTADVAAWAERVVAYLSLIHI